MAIKPPAWCSDAVPTPNGWKHPQTGETLVSGRIKAEDIAAWNEAKNPTPVVVETFKPKTLKESPVTEEEFAEEHLEEMTKVELEEIGREHGVELDRRQKHSTLVGKVKSLID